MTVPVTRLVTAAALALAVTGCQDPYARDRVAAPPADRPVATPGDTARPGALAAPIPPAVVERPSASARRAARWFATRWSNWDWRSAVEQQRALARLAAGELARVLRANAASARIDASLARDKPGLRGTVAAIDLKTADAQAAGIVVTREQTYTDDRAQLGGQRYRVYVIRLNFEQSGWAVSAWAPQP